MQKKIVFIGTYTKKTSKGIYAYHWLPESGELVEIGLAVKTEDPSFLAISPTRKALYAVNELDPSSGKETGMVSSFDMEGDSGKLTFHNTVPSGGTAPCNMAVDPTGQSLFVANYTSGSVATFRILPNGNLSPLVDNIYYPGHSVNVSRQQSAHAHCTTISPDHRFFLVNDLGLDRIMVYRFTPETAKITPNDPPFYSAIPGSGPRNFAFHPNGLWAYSANEIASTVDILHWNSQSGTLTRIQNLSTLPAHVSAVSNTAATVVVHPQGSFVYISNRGDDSIAVFSVHSGDGTLTLVQHISCEGKTPRNIALDPSGKWLLIANQDSANIVVLKWDASTGRLASTARQYALDSPVCIVFA